MDISPLKLSEQPRDWLARRVDLIVSPYNQYYYALVGWTGNKQFNRDLRLYATRELGMHLTSHGLYDLKKVCQYRIPNTVKILKFGTPQTIAIIVLRIEKFDETLH